jgi:hypothetical protein
LKESVSSRAKSPWAAIAATPTMVMNAPTACHGVTRAPKITRAPISTKAGMAPWRIERFRAPVRWAAV